MDILAQTSPTPEQVLFELGLSLRSSTLLEAAYLGLRGVMLVPITGMHGIAIDLEALPKTPFSFKEVFIKWCLSANEQRIKSGRKPLFTLGLVKACPLWKLVPPPFITLELTKDTLLKKAVGTRKPVIGTTTGGALNRSKG